LADHLKPAGRIRLDVGAAKALTLNGKSLLPIGATAVEGAFERGEVVSVLGPEGQEIARGLVNYGAAETARILRKPTSEIETILGYVAEPELIHRDNLVVL
jgi:glutamate 5-kinase